MAFLIDNNSELRINDSAEIAVFEEISYTGKLSIK